jgi:P-type E1-E2 ATPase
VISKFASESLRNILLTYREVTSEGEKDLAPEEVEKNLIVIGMVGIKDPLRDGIPQAVQLCHRAGVRVRMVTGDNKETAVAISKEAGILDKDYNPQKEKYAVMEGKDFRVFVGGLIKEEGRDAEQVGNL